MADRRLVPTVTPARVATAAEASEKRFEFQRHDRFLCKLRDHGDAYGIEAQFCQNAEFVIGRRFDQSMSRRQTPRELAVQWSEDEPRAIETAR